MEEIEDQEFFLVKRFECGSYLDPPNARMYL